MITDLNDLAAAIGDGENDKPVTNEVRSAWNDYTDWLDKRGMKGNPSLDKNNLGKNLLSKYIKEHPKTPLTIEHVIPIQKDFAKYRNWSLDQIKQGKGAFAEGVNEDNYLKELSIIDSYPGQYTTRHKFPKEYLQTFENGQLAKTEDKGLINTSNPVLPQ